MKLNKKIIQTNIEYAISDSGKLKMTKTDHDMTSFYNQPGMVFVDHHVDLNDLDTNLLNKKIEQNASFFKALPSIGIKTLLVHNHTIPTVFLDLNFYIGAFLYSSLEQVLSYLKHDQKHLKQSFIHPLFSGSLKAQAMTDLNWRRYFSESEERYISGKKAHAAMVRQ